MIVKLEHYLLEIGTTTVIKAGSTPALLCSATYATDPDGRWLIGDFVTGINLNIITIVLISMAICMLIEWVRKCDLKAVCDGFTHFLKGMGTAFYRRGGLTGGRRCVLLMGLKALAR